MDYSNEKAPLEHHNVRPDTDLPPTKEGSDDEFAISWTVEEETTVRHKLDWQIVSFRTQLCATYPDDGRSRW